MFDEKLTLPVVISKVKDPDTYYTALSGSQLVCTVLDSDLNLVARGVGMSWNENYQKTPILEWGHRHVVEIVTGMQNIGQITVQSMFFMQLNDVMPTFKNLVSRRELQVIVQIAEHEDPKLAGLVVDVFQGVHIQGQSGNWSAQSLYLRNAQLLYRKRLTGLDWAKQQNNTDYPANWGEMPKTALKIGNK